MLNLSLASYPAADEASLSLIGFYLVPLPDVDVDTILAYWIAFGPYGPRAEAPPGEGWRLVKLVSGFLVASAVTFWGTRQFAGPPPKTMSKEWQEASNEYLKVSRHAAHALVQSLTQLQGEKSEPITGFSSPDYKGKGMVQSKPTGLKIESEDEDEDDD